MIQIGFPSQQILLSCRVPDVTILTDAPSVEFKLQTGAIVLLQSTYSAHDNVVTVSDIASLIEAYMEGVPGRELCNFRIVADNGENPPIFVDFAVMYCQSDIDVADFPAWAKENFLTPAPIQRVAPDGAVCLSWLASANEPKTLYVHTSYLDDRGERGHASFINSGNAGTSPAAMIESMTIGVKEIEASLNAHLPFKVSALLSFTILRGARAVTYFLDPSLSGAQVFAFLNNFGMVEQVAVPAVTTEKFKADRSIASLGRRSQFYDVILSKEYEVTSAGLTSHECALLEQMLTSCSVRIPGSNTEAGTAFANMLPILISDFTSEISNADDKLNSVKFTWRYADNRPRMVAPSSPGIFNNIFQPPFS